MRCTISWSLPTTVYWLRDEGGIGWSTLLQESAIEYPYVCYAPTLKKSRLHFVRDAAAEKEFDIAI